MARNTTSPWSTGPGEILRHGLDLLGSDSDVNRRLAMISIDNAVELMIKTYLGLPRRITSLVIPRREYEAFSQSFPLLLDALETHATDKLDGIDLGEIEWYHRLRNELYHQGNGLTVERDKVEVYSELANLLFHNLFGVRLIEPENDRTEMLGEFMAEWIALERMLDRTPHAIDIETPRGTVIILRRLFDDDIISASELDEINNIRQIRNKIVHGQTDHNTAVTSELIRKLGEIIRNIQRRLTDYEE